MSAIMVILLITVVKLTPGSSLPFRKTDLSNEQLHHKIEAGTLLDILARLMNAIEEEARSQGKDLYGLQGRQICCLKKNYLTNDVTAELIGQNS